ncbi:MAG: polyprenyl synthetase family protein [Treponema sp.]|jgi:octaprenyl-diphosphate synthase|nr:polyprenyl synthetase family protein [Treponema sp.]
MEQKYTQRLEKIEAELKRWLPETADSAWAEKVFPGIGKRINEETIHSLLAPLRDILSRGGKRWRPLFMTLVCETFGGGDSAIPLAPLLEFSHNASLIHDDIEDDSDERRGKPAIHSIYGVDTAINLGSFFYFLSSSCIDSCELKNKDAIYKLWTDCMRKLHLGQSMDINWHRNISLVPSIEEYYLMAAMKTGSLARLAAELGALIAGATPQAAQLMGSAAERMGVGFQILDDVKNLTTGVPGKRRGDDVVEGKKGLPVLMYLNKYPEKHGMVFYCFHVAKTDGAAVQEVDDLINALKDSGVFEEAEEKGHSLLKEMQDIFVSNDFAGCNINESGRELLKGFIKLIS